MALLGEASIKVKRAILLAEEFTVSQIAHTTGIKCESVETVVQRLLKDGVLTKVIFAKAIETGMPAAKRGRPKQYYTFADKSKIKMIRDSVDAFSLEHSVVEPDKEKPSNPYFVKVLSLLDSLETSRMELTNDLSNEIEDNIRISREYEELVDENNEIAMAHIDFADARIKYMQGESDDAEDLLIKARNVFRKYEAPEETAINEYLLSAKLNWLAIETRRVFKSEHYESLTVKLGNLADELSSFTFLPSVTSRMREFVISVSQLSSVTSELINSKKKLEEQNYRLYEENERLRIQQQMFNEINLNLSQAVKVSLSREFYYPQQELPEKSLITNERLNLSDNVISIFDRVGKKRKAAAK